MIKKLFILIIPLILSISAFAQLEVKEGSFKEVPGFVNINPDPDYQTDDNDLPFAVIKVRTVNINNKQRRELLFEGNAGTFIMLEYKTGEVWVYLTAKYADYLKISHPDFSSTEFDLPFDLKPKCGYEMTLVNNQFEFVKLDDGENTEHTPKTFTNAFSVSENKRVYFSKGNLQYQASTKIWRFAEHQWDVVGEDNKKISPRYKGWIDLFGWGTGDNPTNNSTHNNKYSSFTDWGNNYISNGRDKDWRTLTYEEWLYVFDTRKTSGGIRYAKANVNGVDGVILLPDNWDNSTYELNNANEGNGSYNSNTISSIDWINKFEDAGAIFLPIALIRPWSNIIRNKIGSVGAYWSSSFKDKDTAYGIYFNDNLAIGECSRCLGISVRLVCPAE